MLVRQARQKSLVMEPEASLLLKKYFVASRRARANDGVKGKEILKKKTVVPSILPFLISALVFKKWSDRKNKGTVLCETALISILECLHFFSFDHF